MQKTIPALIKNRLLCPQMTYWLYNESKKNVWFVVLEAVLVLKKSSFIYIQMAAFTIKGIIVLIVLIVHTLLLTNH